MFDDADFVAYFCSAKDCYEWTNRLVNSSADELDFFLHQESSCAFKVRSDSDVGSMCTVSRTECIVYEQVAQASPVFAQFSIVFAFFFAVNIFETSVFEYQNISIFQSCNCSFQSFAACFRNESDFFAQQFSQTVSYRLQAQLRFVFFSFYFS